MLLAGNGIGNVGNGKRITEDGNRRWVIAKVRAGRKIARCEEVPWERVDLRRSQRNSTPDPAAQRSHLWRMAPPKDPLAGATLVFEACGSVLSR